MRWWNGFNNGSQRWNLRNLNCANIVYKVLHEGGLVDSAEGQANVDSIFPFTHGGSSVSQPTSRLVSRNLQHNASFRENSSRNWRLSTSL